MENIPDHPVIRACERYGYPYGEEVEKPIICPECGKEAEVFYIMNGNVCKDIVGCNNCIRVIDSWKWEEYI